MKTFWIILGAAWAMCCGFATTTFARVEVQAVEPGRCLVVWTLDDLRLTPADVAGTPAVTVAVPGTLPRQEAGRPELPTATVTLEIPGSGTPRLQVLDRVEGIRVSDPVRPSLGHVTRDRDPAALVPGFGPDYAGDGVFPAQDLELGRPFVAGDRRGVTVRLNPVRWDAARGALRVTEVLTFEILTEGPGGENTLPAALPAASAPVRAALDRAFANAAVADPAAKSASAPAPRARMLIVSHDDFVGALDSFREWKARRGIPVSVLPLSATGGTAADVRRAIAADYAATPGLTWVLLVGDREQLPTNAGTYDGSDADTPYGMILGDDLYPEVYVSRVSVRTAAEAAAQLGKFVAYERDPDTGVDAAWYARAAGVASDEGVPADYERAELLRTDLLAAAYDGVDRIYQSLGATTGTVAGALAEGRSLVNYLGHGSGLSWDSVPFDVDDVAALDNGGRLPWIIDVSCSNGEFARETCFAEAWLRAGSADAPAGAVGMIAASSLAPWTPPTVMQAEVVDLLTSGATTNLGALYYGGLRKVLDEYAGIPVATQVIEQNIVFGDASLQVRTRAPRNFALSGPVVVDGGSGQVIVTVGGSDAGTIAVTADGVLLAAADFAGAGEVRLAVPSLAAHEKVAVTLTGADMVPYDALLPVSAGATPVGDPLVPTVARLQGNFPNPFNPVTTIRFSLPRDMRVRLTVHDVAGRAVRTLVDGHLAAGARQVRWTGRDDAGRAAPSGVYLYRLETPDGAQVGRMLLAK